MHLRALALVAALLLSAWAWRASGAAGASPSAPPPSSPVITATTLRLAPPRPAAQNFGQTEMAETRDQKKLAGLPRLRAVIVSRRETAQ
jgi:hypothetical protein